MENNSYFDLKDLFFSLYNSGTEKELDNVLSANSKLFGNPSNWRPLDGNENNFGVIENQQSSPIASIIEKLTNSIDAILMKECLSRNIDPKSTEAPRSILEAKDLFFEKHKEEWRLKTFRRKQAEKIQIIADGKPRDTSVIIYDNGEGQHPEYFESTFLSLLRGNKNEIKFVQGKYNMGGSGAIVFCGRRGYQLVASKRFDGTGKFGFTLVRQHPFTKEEEKVKKNTWYEYFIVDGKIPCFDIETLDLKLHNREFTTGTVIKLYSYQFPSGYSGFAQDLNQSINEFLFDPALPILTVEKKERYPNNKVLELDVYGLKRRLEEEDGYIEDKFSETFEDELFGTMKVNCYIFKARVKGNDVKKTRENIQNRFFKNNMAVLFSMNGQVHGHYTSEFITRSLKLSILKNHLLIHVDCTDMDYNFRKELFMASRDRLKDGRETKALRKYLGNKLGSSKSRLGLISKARKDSISVSGESTKELLRDFTKNLPVSDELRKLLGDAFKVEPKKRQKSSGKQNQEGKGTKASEPEVPFQPNRYPSFLKLKTKKGGDIPVTQVPLGGEKVIKFDTDVEDSYFDRVDDPGDLQIALLKYEPNDSTGGDALGKPSAVSEVLNVVKSSPKKGEIRVVVAPKKNVQVGDAIQLKVTLTDKGQEHDQIFWVKVRQPDNKPKEKKKESIEEPPGLPEVILVYLNPPEGDSVISKEEFENTGESMGYETVMFPMAEGDALEKIFINMDSNVLKSFKSKQKNISEEQNEIADRKYISSVYFHTLFLYTITKKKGYNFTQEIEGQQKEVDIGEYIKDLFDSFYSEFILSFGTVDIIDSI